MTRLSLLLSVHLLCVQHAHTLKCFLRRPPLTRYVSETGTGAGAGFTVNVPLPPGSGSGAYKDAFERVVIPALEAFKPELILVSSGFDAAYMDPLGSMMLSSLDFG